MLRPSMASGYGRLHLRSRQKLVKIAPMRRLSWLIFGIALLAGRAVAESPAPAVRYDVAAMPVRDALVDLARQSGVSIGFEGLSLDGYRSGYVIGANSLETALARILSSTPYGFEYIGPDTIRLTLRDAKAHRDQPNEPRDESMIDVVDMIVVTATKRPAEAYGLPVAVSVLGEEALSRSGARGANDISPRIAGVAFTNLGTSRNKIFVRGLSDGPFADRTQSTVGVYLDETPVILNDTNPDLRLLDMQRVEIVRGPQGSLYGGGAIGGLFRMITVKPDLEDFSGRINASGAATQSGGPGGSIDGIVNLPLIENEFAVRAVGYYEKPAGYIKDIGLGQDNVNSSNIFGGRVAARWALSGHWALDAQYARQRVSLDGAQYVFPSLGGLTRETFRAEPHNDEFDLANVTVTGAVGRVTVTSSTSYVWRTIDDASDATIAIPLILPATSGEGVFKTEDRISSLTHESRMTSANDGDWKWLVGAFYSNRNEQLGSRLTVDTASQTIIPFVSDRSDQIAEVALFGEATYSFSEAIALTIGARLSNTSYEVNVASSGLVQLGNPLIDIKNTIFGVSPKIAATYEIQPNFLTYAQVSHGSRIGGVNVSTPLGAFVDPDSDANTTTFEPDSLWNFELGAKSNWLNGDLDVNLSAFYVIWNDVQTDQFLSSGFSFIANAGRARNYGFELESAYRPTENLEIAAALFWNSPELREANAFLGAAKGNALPNIAELSAGLTLSYQTPIVGRWSALATGGINYVGKSYLTFQNGVAAPMGDFAKADIRLSVMRDRFEAGVYAENLTNERGNTFSFGNPFSFGARPQETPLRPRTFGVFVRKDF